jgi:hypothetical protein
LGWVNTRSITSQQAVISQQNGGGTGRTWFIVNPSGCIGKFGNNLAGVITCSSASVSANTWYQFALTYNTTSVRMFINGTLTNSTNLNPDENANGDVLFGTNKGLGQDFNGSIDNFMFYNRTLTDIEVQEVYNLSRITNPSVNQTDLQVWYRMDEGSGTTTFDSINDYSASLEGNANWTNLGTGIAQCSYDYLDLDNDAQNTTITFYQWFINWIEQVSYENQSVIIEDNYPICCVKSFDDVFVTGNEQLVCNQDPFSSISINETRFPFILILTVIFIVGVIYAKKV